MAQKKLKQKRYTSKFKRRINFFALISGVSIICALMLLISAVLFIRKHKIAVPQFPLPHKQSWCQSCIATAIDIPSIGFSDTAIAMVGFDQHQQTWPTPVSGIATPKEIIPNNIIIFGHSKWFGKQYPFANIAKLAPGASITVTDQFGQKHVFRVQRIMLFDQQDGTPVHAKSALQLTLLTSARYQGSWLLPTQLDSHAIDETKNNQAYAILVITATPN